MSHHEETFAVDVTDDPEESLQRLVEFYHHNGYTDTPSEDDDPRRHGFRRGSAGASWWSSDMTRLRTEVTVDVDAERISYRVQTTGQNLTDEDRAFWRREAQAAGDYLRARRELLDLRPEEARRAERVQRDYRTFGLQAAAIIVFAIVVAGVVGAYLGVL